MTRAAHPGGYHCGAGSRELVVVQGAGDGRHKGCARAARLGSCGGPCQGESSSRQHAPVRGGTTPLNRFEEVSRLREPSAARMLVQLLFMLWGRGQRQPPIHACACSAHATSTEAPTCCATRPGCLPLTGPGCKGACPPAHCRPVAAPAPRLHARSGRRIGGWAEQAGVACTALAR